MEINTMKLKTVAVALLALVLSAVPLSAQTYLSSTTFSSAVTSTSATQVRVASATGVVVGGGLYVDREYMTVTSVSGTLIGVIRGSMGTKAGLHTTAANVIVAPLAALRGALPAFGQTDPAIGSCNPASHAYLPIINVVSGDLWLCWAQGSSGFNAQRLWHATNVGSVNGTASLLLNLQ